MGVDRGRAVKRLRPRDIAAEGPRMPNLREAGRTWFAVAGLEYRLPRFQVADTVRTEFSTLARRWPVFHWRFLQRRTAKLMGWPVL